MSKILAFDLGKVVFDFDYNIALEKIKDNIEASPEEVIYELFYNDFARDFEKGVITARQFYTRFKKRFSLSLGYDKFAKIWCDIFSPCEEIIKLIEQLRFNYPLYLISNINKLHFQHLYSKHRRVFLLFRELILSFKIKAVKPERKIYEELRKKCGSDYSNIIYIDDRQDLISQARKLNLKCIEYKHPNQLIKELNSLGIKLLR